MKVKMIKDCQGSNCGKFMSDYKQGEVYELSDELASNFIGRGVAESMDEKMMNSPDNKSMSEANYQNKADKPKAKKKGDE